MLNLLAYGIAVVCGLYSNPFWFLIMLFMVMMVAAVAFVITYNIFPKSIRNYLLPVIAFTIALCCNYLYDKTSDFILYFLIGYYLRAIDIFKYKWTTNNILPLLMLVLGLTLLIFNDKDMINFWDFHFREFITIKPFYLYPLRYICACSISAFFILCARKLNVRYSLFSFMGTFTLPLYMVHARSIQLVNRLDIHLQLNDIEYMCYAIPTTIVWVVVCSAFIIFTLRFNIVRKYFWGMSS